MRSPHGGPKITWGRSAADAEGREGRLRFDLATGDQGAEVERLVSLGVTRIDNGQGEVGWIVLADPDGNECCVITPAPVGQEP